MKILSFQGKAVWDSILKHGMNYHADWNLAREHVTLDDLTKDILQLSGECPIWGYTQPYFNYTNMWNGDMIEKIRCEMSLDQEDAFKDMYMLELEIPLKEVFNGCNHNDNKFVVTFGRIEPDWVKAVYTVEDCKKGSHMEQWYYKIITNIHTNVPTGGGLLDVITTSKIDMYQLSLEDEWSEDKHPPISTSVGKEAKCLECGDITKIWYKNKPICSLTCLTAMQNKFDIAGIEFRVHGSEVFDKASEKECRDESVRDLVCLYAGDVHTKNYEGWYSTVGKHYEWRK